MRASGPLQPISTPAHDTGKDDAVTIDASHMALVHNFLIHTHNSIYQQAPKLKTVDVADFVQYCLSYHDAVKLHHEGEEVVLFPGIEAAIDRKGYFAGDVAQHHSFEDALDRFKKHLDIAVADSSAFSGIEVVSILDDLGPSLHEHLLNEPPKLAALADIPDFDIKPISAEFHKYTYSRSSMVARLPILWFNLDADFEGGRWADWPADMPGWVKWVLIHGVAQWHASYWRFGSSGPDGVQRDLLCLTDEYAPAS